MATLSTFFGAGCSAAAIGLYGVISYGVADAQKRLESGWRSAQSGIRSLVDPAEALLLVVIGEPRTTRRVGSNAPVSSLCLD